jgi:hypothetical protein
VVDADSGAPIRLAEVVAVNRFAPDERSTKTDDEGRFGFEDLLPGAWVVTASKTGYTTLQLGQRRPFERVEPVPLRAGDRVAGDIALRRAGVVTGRIHDEYGDPLAGVRVQVMRAGISQQRRHLQPVGEGDLTDDTGAFRIHSLPPGEYYVAASLRVAPVESGIQTTYAPTYYPGTAAYAEAQRVLVGGGAEANVAFPVLPFRTARVTGMVISSRGGPGDALLNLSSEAGELGVPLGIGGATQPDGTFTLPDVPPGTYTLTAALRGEGQLGSEVASHPVTVYGDDVGGLTLVTAPPGTVRGSVVGDAGNERQIPPKLSVLARSVKPGGEATFGDVVENAFAFALPVGPLRLSVDAPDGWAVKAILVHERDVTDEAIDAGGEQDIPVRVVLTDRPTEVSGTVTAAGVRAGAAVVVFPDDASRWEPPSRYVRTAAVDERGTFRIAGLPGGRRYRAVAVETLDAGEGEDPEFLSRIRDRATPFDLVDAERRRLDLQIVGR